MNRAVPALLVALALATASVAMGGVPGATDAADRTTTAAVDDPGNGTSNASYGTAISTFMAESAANANATVDQEMWEAAVNASGPVESLTNARVQTLQKRLDRVLEQRRELLAAHENGTVPEVAFQVRLSNLNARIEQLSAAANATATVAKTHGVTPPGLQDLVSNATEVARAVGENPPGLPGPLGNWTDKGEGTPGQGGADVPGNDTDPGNGTVPGNGPDETPGDAGGDGDTTTGVNTTVSANITTDVPGDGDDPSTDAANNTTTTTDGGVL